MNISINYLPNETGLDIQQTLKNELLPTKNRLTAISGLEHLEINIIDDKTQATQIINTAKAIKNAMDVEVLSTIYSINSIASDLEKLDPVVRTYDVLICDLNIISIRLTINSKPKNQVKYIKETENSKVCDMAKRALYLIGLDVGMVSIVLTTKRRLKVNEVNPSPIIRERDLPVVIKKIKEMYSNDELIKSREIKLGADPEFMLFNSKNGKMISASEFFPRDGLVGCDNIRIPNRQQRPIAEIRPKPDESPLELIDNIKQALASAGKLAPYKNVKWVAGSQPMNGYSIGGHIHFSKIKVNGKLIRALDNYLAIPFFLIEEPTTAAKRRKRYGFLADYRVKEHGGFEYRTLSSWLVSQKIATAVLCLAKIIASRYPYLSQNYFENSEAQQAFYNGEQSYFLKHFNNLWSNIENTDIYNEYADELSIIPEMILGGQNWDEKSDFRKSWKITTANKNYNKNQTGIKTSQPVIASTPAPQTNNRGVTPATRNTRITIRSTPTNNTDRRANNITSGRIIGSGQVRGTHRIR